MTLEIEEGLRARGFTFIAGADEVGRGALAGPLVACAVILRPEEKIEGLKDSKLCTPKEREGLARVIKERAIAISLVRKMPKVIDRRGLHKTNLSALRLALTRLAVKPDYALTDGYPVWRPPVPSLSLKKGDRISASIAAASIVAKVSRDRAMVRLHRRYPEYGFRSNKGYGTPDHRDALKRLGPSPVHRLSFYGFTSGYYPAAAAEDHAQVEEEWA